MILAGILNTMERQQLHFLCIYIVFAHASSHVLATRRHNAVIQTNKESAHENFYTPDIIPVGLDVMLIDGSVTLQFKVKHTVPGKVFNPVSLEAPGQTEEKHLQLGPDEPIPKTSLVNFHIPNNWCDKGKHTAGFIFENHQGEFSTVDVNPCYFHSIWKNVGENLTDMATVGVEPNTSQQIQVEHVDISFSRFSDLDIPGNAMTILQNTNTTFTIGIMLPDLTDVKFDFLFYQPQLDAFLVSYFYLWSDNGNIATHRYSNDIIRENKLENIFSVKALTDDHTADTELFKAGHGVHIYNISNMQYNMVRKTLRVNVNTASESVSGIICLEASKYFSDSGTEGPIPFTTFSLPIVVKESDATEPLPIGKYYFFSSGDFGCYPDGTQQNSDVQGCHVKCTAFGIGIKSIEIFKLLRNDTDNIWRSRSLIQTYYATALLMLGDPHKSIEGEYVCKVTGQNGLTERKVMRMSLTGYPVIDTSRSSFSNLGNGTTVITCTVKADPPPDIVIYDGYNRVDDVPEYTRHIFQSGIDFMLTLSMPTDDLRNPQTLISCSASNTEGSYAMYY